MTENDWSPTVRCRVNWPKNWQESTDSKFSFSKAILSSSVNFKCQLGSMSVYFLEVRSPKITQAAKKFYKGNSYYRKT